MPKVFVTVTYSGVVGYDTHPSEVIGSWPEELDLEPYIGTLYYDYSDISRVNDPEDTVR